MKINPILFGNSSNDAYLCHVKVKAMPIEEEGLKGREEYLQDLRFLLRHEDEFLEEEFYTREDLDKLINEDCKGIVDALTDE